MNCNVLKPVDDLAHIHEVKNFAWVNDLTNDNVTYISDMDPNGQFEARLINYTGRVLYLRTDVEVALTCFVPIPPTKRRTHNIEYSIPTTGATFVDDKLQLDKNGNMINFPVPEYKNAIVNIIPYEEYYHMFYQWHEIESPTNPLNYCCCVVTDKADMIKLFIYRKTAHDAEVLF
jgi:hypothetical protein